ncbi:hypothetical protein HD553DRAFT_33963 [Filobasidium floriforme]|uniref:uncharacterized protein n=1 Tax=Filobasidium floriforme TaxID=5210 RepID=UPI001E8D6E6D|nr:uncharacterized protein HD553DRAFT_33963 [Filobasidium floriforme]KAH8084729.1 hypothetical protein HD553DRAFT_33963 [Filobasidium floriforme]
MPVYQPFRKPHNDLESLIHGSLVSSLKPLRCNVPNRYHLVKITKMTIMEFWSRTLFQAFATESSGYPMTSPNDLVHGNSRNEREVVWFIRQQCRDWEALGFQREWVLNVLMEEFNGVGQHRASVIREMQRWTAADTARDVPGNLKTMEELLAWIDEFHASQDNHDTTSADGA